MASLSDIDALTATLHPHILRRFFNCNLFPPRSLNPRKDTADLRNLVQAFVTLFSFHPGCDTAAATAQVCQPETGDTSLYICLAPSTPPGFETHIDQWLQQFMAMRQESQVTRGTRQDDSCSELEERFILYTYNLCYPTMRQSNSEALYEWSVVASRATQPAPHANPTKDEKERRDKYKDKLQQLSDRVQAFMKIISSEAVPQGAEMLKFHKLCLEIYDIIMSDGICSFIATYIYSAAVMLELICLPFELSILLDISRRPSLVCDGKWSSHILDPSIGARQFSAVVTETDLVERFGKVPDMDWEIVMKLFTRFTSGAMKEDGGYEWHPDRNLLSTRGPVNVHPEIALIQHLLENSDNTAEAYLACSRTPCYPSVLYAGALNETLGTKFTMRLDHPDWCQLHKLEPWVLPEVADSKAMAQMKEYLLRDLRELVHEVIMGKPAGWDFK